MTKSEAGRGRAAAPEKVAHPEDQEYAQALARLASVAGIAPGELEKSVLAAAASPVNPDCVTLDEIEHFSTLRQLPEDRQSHVAQCDDCQKFLAAISPQADEVEEFARSAVGPQPRSRPV